jgi:hypothetical protein
MGEPVGLFMLAGGVFKCNFVTNFQIEVCILAPTTLGGGQYKAVECNEETEKKGEIKDEVSHGGALAGITCAEGIYYEAWVWDSRSILATGLRQKEKRRLRTRVREAEAQSLDLK